MRILQNITKEQSDEVNNIIEKRAALQNLKMILDHADENTIYNKCMEELDDTENQYSKWWSDRVEEYGLEKYWDNELCVDSVKRYIYVE